MLRLSQDIEGLNYMNKIINLLAGDKSLEETKKEIFYNMFHCERCSKIFKTLTDETFKHLTTAQCKEELLKLNVSANEEFKDGIKKHIKSF